MNGLASGAAPRSRPKKAMFEEDDHMDTSGQNNSLYHEKIIEMSEHNGTWKNSETLWATLQNNSHKIKKNLKAQV